MLSKVIAGDEDKPTQNKNDEAIIDQQSTLWSASSGIEWQGKIIHIKYFFLFYF